METNKVKYFLMFCCPPRSGHTLVASILNSHPNVICSNQMFIMNMVTEDPEFNLARINILNKIESGTDRSKWNPNAYIEPVPKKDLTVVGDKTGHRTTERLISNPYDLETFKKIIPWPIKWIHVVRNPFDNLATWTKKNHDNKGGDINAEFRSVYDKYVALNDKIIQLKKTEDVLTVTHERVIRFIDKTLDEICAFLEIEKDDDWRSRVIKAKWKDPRITRRNINWNPNMRAKAVMLTKQYPWFNGYAMGG